MMLRRSWTLAIALMGASLAEAAIPPGLALAQQYACTACHGLDHAVVGPAYQAVAQKYKSDADALSKMMAKVKAGGAGAWGSVPMPAQPQIPDADLKTILSWVLSGAAAQ